MIMRGQDNEMYMKMEGINFSQAIIAELCNNYKARQSHIVMDRGDVAELSGCKRDLWGASTRPRRSSCIRSAYRDQLDNAIVLYFIRCTGETREHFVGDHRSKSHDGGDNAQGVISNKSNQRFTGNTADQATMIRYDLTSDGQGLNVEKFAMEHTRDSCCILLRAVRQSQLSQRLTVNKHVWKG